MAFLFLFTFIVGFGSAQPDFVDGVDAVLPHEPWGFADSYGGVVLLYTFMVAWCLQLEEDGNVMLRCCVILFSAFLVH